MATGVGARSVRTGSATSGIPGLETRNWEKLKRQNAVVYCRWLESERSYGFFLFSSTSYFSSFHCCGSSSPSSRSRNAGYFSSFHRCCVSSSPSSRNAGEAGVGGWGDDVDKLLRERLLWRKRAAGVPARALAEDGVGASSPSVPVPQEETDDRALIEALTEAIARKDTEAVKKTLDQLKQEGWAKQWSTFPNISRRATYKRELTSLGIKNAENLAIPSVRNDAAFLATVVGTTGFLAVLAGQLPGDWGFFVPYLLGSISLVVLAIGSTAPGLLQVAINSFSSVFPDYKERLLWHEAAHFLVAYLLGLPVLGYSLDIGKEHVNLMNESLQKRIYEGFLDDKELDRLAVVSMAGIAAEGLKFDKVVGQSADLFSLQRLINRSKPKLSNEQQQNLTRWAVLYSASLLKNNAKLYESLMSAMSKNSPVFECIKAIEKPVDPLQVSSVTSTKQGSLY